MSSKSLKMSKRKEKKNEQQKDESTDGVNETYHEGDDDYVSKKCVYGMMKVQESMSRNLFESMSTSVNNRSDGVIKDLTELKSSIHITIIFCLVAFATSF